jgi:homoserine kinase
MQRLAVLTTALGQTPPDPELIFEAMKDRVHQPYRNTLVRRLFRFIAGILTLTSIRYLAYQQLLP